VARRTTRLRHAVVALPLVAVLCACAAGQDGPAPAKATDPMEGFARLVDGEWRQTARSGRNMFHAWHWGPGRHSIRRMTDGSGAGGDPWREVQVYYWHPGRKQVRMLGVSPFDRGVSEGEIKFDGEKAEGVFDLHQTRGLRKMGRRWAFDGHDKYRDTLMESSGRDGLQPLVEFDLIRTKPPARPRPRAVDGAVLSKHLKPLEPLLGHTWEATGDAFRTVFEWVPLADAIYARVVGMDGEHLLDAYVYHHTGANALRCLALSHRGGVYEGDLTVLDGGALQLEPKGYEGERVVRHVVRFDFEKDGTLRHRVWSARGADRTLLLDVHHKKLSGSPNLPSH
jgi:hypothetical protein